VLQDIQGSWLGIELRKPGCVHCVHDWKGQTESYIFFLKEMDDKTRIYLDLSSIKKPKHIKQMHKRHCHILVDKKTQMKFVNFFDMKDGMVEPTCEKLKNGQWW
jgi:hypothetical protein